MVDLARAVSGELRVLENDVAHMGVAVLQLPDIDGFRHAAKRHVQDRQVFGARQCMQRTVGRCRDSDVPAGSPQRMRQVAYYVADAADLAAGQGTVF